MAKVDLAANRVINRSRQVGAARPESGGAPGNNANPAFRQVKNDENKMVKNFGEAYRGNNPLDKSEE